MPAIHLGRRNVILRSGEAYDMRKRTFAIVEHLCSLRPSAFNTTFEWLRPVVEAKCGGNFDCLNIHLTEDYHSTSTQYQSVSLLECLEYATKWKILPVSQFINHMESKGGRTYGGVLGQVL
jgi:hypothetical protein